MCVFACVACARCTVLGPRYVCCSAAQIVARLNDALEDYNITNPTQMNLVFFRDAVEHVCRISRILRQPRGNAMLVGVGGSGKQSLTRMACALGGSKCFQIELTRGYGLVEFREDLKKIMLQSGVENKQVVFLFTDTQIVQESFLEDVNNVLNTGEVPNLWQTDEANKIIEDVRPAAQALVRVCSCDVVSVHGSLVCMRVCC